MSKRLCATQRHSIAPRLTRVIEALEIRVLLSGYLYAGELDPTVQQTSLNGTAVAYAAAQGGGYYGLLDTTHQTVVAKYRTDGSLDPTFGNGGVVTRDVSFQHNEYPTGLAVLPNNNVLVTGNLATDT